MSKILNTLTMSLGLVVMGDDSCPRGHGFKSRCRILDGQLDIFHIDLLLKLYCLLEKTENKRKKAHLKNQKSNIKSILGVERESWREA